MQTVDFLKQHVDRLQQGCGDQLVNMKVDDINSIKPTHSLYGPNSVEFPYKIMVSRGCSILGRDASFNEQKHVCPYWQPSKRTLKM